jgi:hypothetical protein
MWQCPVCGLDIDRVDHIIFIDGVACCRAMVALESKVWRAAWHHSSAYHRNAWLGRVYCSVVECDHPEHVPAYRFYCVNPHCTNAAHTL